MWAKAMELEYKVMGYANKSIYYKYTTIFSFLIVIETCTFLRLIYPGIASILNATPEIRREIMGGRRVKFNPYRTPIVNTFLLLYMSVSANWSLRKVNRGSISGAMLWLRIAFLMSTRFLVNQYMEFTALLVLKFQDSVFSCSMMSVLGLHGSHVFVAWVWIIYNWSMAAKGCMTLGGSPRYANIVTYIHFTDVVWFGVIGIYYV